MVQLFYVDDCLIFSPSKDKIYDVYASLQAYFNIDYDGDIRTYLGIELDCCPDGSIHLRQPYPAKRKFNLIPGMEKSSSKRNPEVKTPLAKNEGAQPRKINLITGQR